MAYATIADMCDRFGEECLMQLAPPDLPDPGLGSGPCEPAILAALDDASKIVDAYAGARYKTPLNPVPAAVTAWTCDIALWRLDHSKTNEAFYKIYKDAKHDLELVMNGRFPLRCDGIESESAADGDMETAGPARFFSAQSLEGF